MAEDVSLTRGQAFIGLSIGLLGGNALATYFFNQPYLACWLEPMTSALYLWVAPVILYGVSAYIIYQLVRGRFPMVLLGALIFTLVVELPTLASKLFKLGVSCG